MRRGMITAMMLVIAGAVYADEPVPNGICESIDPSTADSCFAYVGTDYANPKYLNKVSNACTNSNSKWSTNTACPTKNRMGVCKMGEGTAHETWRVYYMGNTSPNGAENACKKFLKGTWYPQ